MGDDWYQQHAPRLLAGKAGKKPLFSDMRQHLVARMGLTNGPCQPSVLLIDGTPVQVRHWRRFGKGHLLWPEAALGYCAAKKQTYYGLRLLAVTTLDGIIVAWDLFAANIDFAANTDERDGAQELLENRRSLSVLGDKGFLDQICLGRQGLFGSDLSWATRAFWIRPAKPSCWRSRTCSC